MLHALIIGGSGTIGRAVARRLSAAGWFVTIVGRDAAHVPPDLRRAGIRFVAADRDDHDVFERAIDTDAELVVDCVCFTAGHARQLLPLLGRLTSLVMISSKAVYVDDAGNHSNSATAPDFRGPVTEQQATLPPDASDEYASRDGYGACKVAAEDVLLGSGLPVTVLRPSKVHGEGALKPNEWVFVKRVLDRRPIVPLAYRGQAGDHTSAAVNIAALVEGAAHHPGCRILNAADPDAPSTLEISQVVASHFAHDWLEILLDGPDERLLGRTPWNRWPKVVLDTSAAATLGYRPVGGYAATVHATLDWLAAIAIASDRSARLPDRYDNAYFDRMIDYAVEDQIVSSVAAAR